MKKITKISISVLLIATVVGACFAFVACNDDSSNLVAVAATDLLQEDFGIAVTKGNTSLMSAVNQVVDEWLANGKMNQYMDYYSALAAEENGGENAVAPDGLQTSWDFGSASEVVTMYTESGFAPYEFVKGTSVVGLDVAIMSQVALNMGKKLEVKDVMFDVIATNVAQASGDAVGAAGITINDERKQVVDFSHVYSSSTLVVVSKDGQFKSVKDLAGKERRRAKRARAATLSSVRQRVRDTSMKTRTVRKSSSRQRAQPSSSTSNTLLLFKTSKTDVSTQFSWIKYLRN